MKATDFNLMKELKFNVDTGMATFRKSRLVIFDANAIGLLRQEVLTALGWEDSRRLFFRFGYQHGYADLLQMKIGTQFDSEMDLLASGPTIHTWEGIVKATPKEIRFDRKTGEFYFTGTWTNSYEAEQHLCYNETAKEPICWSLTGYASGWCTAFFGSPLIAMEPVCKGKGDDRCEWLIQPPAKFGSEAQPYIKAVEGFWR